MKVRTNLNLLVLLVTAASLSLIASSCTHDESKCCQGYTGKITNDSANNLVKRCHFIRKDTIEKWVSRYEVFKAQLERKPGYQTNNNDSANAQLAAMKAQLDEISSRFLKSGSVSYNNCIIKKILCDKNSIGLRVLYGISADNRIHIMLVGIQPDYSNLYVDGEDCCGGSFNKTAGAGLTGVSGAPGGAEYGQMP